MNGLAAIRQLLAGNATLTALVPASRIAAGVLPQGTDLPAISVMLVSSVDRNIPAPGAKRRVTDRVQATVMAANYPAQRQILAAIKKAAADTMPAVTGISDVVVHTDSAGPDFMDEKATIYLGSQDFRVTYNEVR